MVYQLTCLVIIVNTEKIILVSFFSLTCLQASELSADPILPSTLEEISSSERKVIACFGDSVTEQAHGNGYVGALAELMPEYEVRRFGYGGRSLFPAGINHIDELLECRPSLILMAWSLLETDEPHSEAIIKVLLKKAQNSGSMFFVFIVGGTIWFSSAFTQIIASIAPAECSATAFT